MVSIPQLLERTGDGLFATDRGQRIVSCNRAACSILGLPEHRVVGRLCYEVLRCRGDEGTAICGPNCWIFRAVRRGEELPSRDMLLRRDDGRYVQCSLSFIAIGDSDDQARALFLFRPKAAVMGLQSATCPEAPPGTEIVVRCFGSFEVWARGNRLAGPPISRKKAGRALRLLIHRGGQKVSRDELAEVLWPDAAPDAARAGLKVMIHTLRRALEPGLGPRQASRFIGYENDSYLFTKSAGCWIDADAFLEHAREGQKHQRQGATDEAQAHYSRALGLYRGDYLTEDLYEDWCAGERQRLRETHKSIIMALASIYASQQDYGRAVDCCWQALADDGCRESIYRHLMDYLLRDGRPHEALQVFHRCQAVLQRELGLPPLPETADLYRRIKAKLGQGINSGRPI